MAVEVKVPAVGESVQEGMIHKWHKADGDFVKVDDVLLELETDKATVDIVAEHSGKISLKKKEGDTVKVGEVLALIDSAAQTEAPAPKAAEKKVEQEKALSSADLSPAVSKIVAEKNLDPSNLKGSGRGGRLTKEDVLAAGSSAASSTSAPASKPSSADLPPTPKKASSPMDSQSAASRSSRKEPMSMLRRRLAQRLLEAQQTNAILTTFNEINMGPVMEVRNRYKEKFKETHGVGLGFMSFFVAAAVEALKKYPAVNGRIVGNDIEYFDYCDIGVAVSTDRGLMVPVLRNTERMSFADIELAIMEYAQKGRAGKISLDDLSGGTFTISNGGVFGSLLSTPILNPPQSAILGMHKTEERPVVENGQIVIRPMMYVALSYDHRIIDGKEAVGFLVKIKEGIEDPVRLMLGV